MVPLRACREEHAGATHCSCCRAIPEHSTPCWLSHVHACTECNVPHKLWGLPQVAMQAFFQLTSLGVST